MESTIINVEKQGDITILTLMLDDVPLYENERLKKAFSTLLDEGSNKIILDLSNTTYISSIVIASFVFMHKRATEAGGNFAICGIREEVRDILNITNLDKVFDIFKDKQEAIAKFNGQ